MSKHKISESLEPCMRLLLTMPQILDKGEVDGSDKHTSLQCRNIEFYSEGIMRGTHKISWGSFTHPILEANFALS
jgi:hypothetical protein